jgi:hypothetical protein
VPELLGHLTAPSGTVLIIDTGLLNLWSHDRPPVPPPGVLPQTTEDLANASVDLLIEGPDALVAGSAFGRQPWSPLHLCDIPQAHLTELTTAFDDSVCAHCFNARLRELPNRIPHRTRVDLTLDAAPAGVVQFHGVWAIAAGHLPTTRSLPVWGERHSLYNDCWQSVWLEVVPDGAVARSESAGKVMVDRARLMFVDADALGAWEHDEPLDGRADFVFWGVDAPEAAGETRAPELGEGQFGWRDLPIEEVVDLGTAVEHLRARKHLRFATDFRPHSHHFYVMDQIRSTTTGSATLTVGGATLCAFSTSWGDGCFPVFRDLDAAGGLVRLRIELGPA